MLWLTWHMWILLLLAFAGGVIVGWVLHGLPDESAEADEKADEASDSISAKPEPVEQEGPSQTVSPRADRGVVEVDIDQNEDDLTRINGLGPKAAQRLKELGITQFSQIAAWGADDISKFEELALTRGRIERDDWVGQAKRLII